jgi:hypothetical protein
MYATVRAYRFGAGSVHDLMRRVDTEFADRLRALPGFVAYQVIDCGDHQLTSVTTFTDSDSAWRSNELAAEFVHERLRDFQIDRTDAQGGAVMVSRAESGVLVATHH